MRHFIYRYRDVRGVVAVDFPAFGAHVADGEEGDGAVAVADDDAVVLR